VGEGSDLEPPVVQDYDGPAVRGIAGERPIGVLALAVAEGMVDAIRFAANPDKLAGLNREATA